MTLPLRLTNEISVSNGGSAIPSSRRWNPAILDANLQRRATAADDVVVHRYRPVMLAPNRREVGLPAVGIGRRR